MANTTKDPGESFFQSLFNGSGEFVPTALINPKHRELNLMGQQFRQREMEVLEEEAMARQQEARQKTMDALVGNASQLREALGGGAGFDPNRPDFPVDQVMIQRGVPEDLARQADTLSYIRDKQNMAARDALVGGTSSVGGGMVSGIDPAIAAIFDRERLADAGTAQFGTKLDMDSATHTVNQNIRQDNEATDNDAYLIDREGMWRMSVIDAEQGAQIAVNAEKAKQARKTQRTKGRVSQRVDDNRAENRLDVDSNRGRLRRRDIRLRAREQRKTNRERYDQERANKWYSTFWKGEQDRETDTNKLNLERRNKRRELMLGGREDRSTEGLKQRGRIELEGAKQGGAIALEERRAELTRERDFLMAQFDAGGDRRDFRSQRRLKNLDAEISETDALLNAAIKREDRALASALRRGEMAAGHKYKLVEAKFNADAKGAFAKLDNELRAARESGNAKLEARLRRQGNRQLFRLRGKREAMKAAQPRQLTSGDRGLISKEVLTGASLGVDEDGYSTLLPGATPQSVQVAADNAQTLAEKYPFPIAIAAGRVTSDRLSYESGATGPISLAPVNLDTGIFDFSSDDASFDNTLVTLAGRLSDWANIYAFMEPTDNPIPLPPPGVPEEQWPIKAAEMSLQKAGVPVVFDGTEFVRGPGGSYLTAEQLRRVNFTVANFDAVVGMEE